jgi:hypothetical protein
MHSSVMLASILKTISDIIRSDESSERRKEWPFARRIWTTVKKNWYLGFTSFGGPPVHFRIVSGIYRNMGDV